MQSMTICRQLIRGVSVSKANVKINPSRARNSVKFYSNKVTNEEATKKRAIGIGGYLLLSVPVATFGFGSFLVMKRSWKQKIIDMLNQPPAEIPENLEDLKNLKHRSLILRGKFDYENEQIITPQFWGGNIKQCPKFSKLGEKYSGNLVITPFKLADRNLIVLVNRGWIPKGQQTLPKASEENGPEEIQVIAVCKNPNKFGNFLGKDVMEKVDKLKQKLNIEHLYFFHTISGNPLFEEFMDVKKWHDALSKSNEMPAIATWYSLSLLTSFLWYRCYWRVR